MIDAPQIMTTGHVLTAIIELTCARPEIRRSWARPSVGIVMILPRLGPGSTI